ncbi:MAG: MlaD family protein [Gemmatimonadota bacterium]
MRDPGLRGHHRAELQVGLFVLFSIIALAAGVVWISGADIGGGRLRVLATGPDAARVSDGTRVYLRGVDVGSVTGVGLSGGRAVLALDIAPGETLPRDTRALIQPSAFLGSGIMELEPGESSTPLAAGDTIAAETVPDLQSLAGALGDQVEQVLTQAQKLLADETVEHVRLTGSALSATMTELQALVEAERESLATLIESLSQTSSQLAEATSGAELGRTITSLDSLTARLHHASKGLDSTSLSLASILDKVDRGDGSLGRLVNDEALYERVSAAAANLEAAMEEIALLTRDVRQHPERYLKGLKFSVF